MEFEDTVRKIEKVLYAMVRGMRRWSVRMSAPISVGMRVTIIVGLRVTIIVGLRVTISVRMSVRMSVRFEELRYAQWTKWWESNPRQQS